MKRYFQQILPKTEFGRYEVYYEFDGDLATRQIEHYGERWMCSLEEVHKETGGLALCDQPLATTGLTTGDAITRAEFDRVWHKAEQVYLQSRSSPGASVYVYMSRRWPKLVLLMRGMYGRSRLWLRYRQ